MKVEMIVSAWLKDAFQIAKDTHLIIDKPCFGKTISCPEFFFLENQERNTLFISLLYLYSKQCSGACTLSSCPFSSDESEIRGKLK